MNYLERGKLFGDCCNQVFGNDIVVSKSIATPSLIVPWHYHENAYFIYNINGHFNEVTKKGTSDLLPNALLYHHSQEAHYNCNIQETFEFIHIEIEQRWFEKYNVNDSVLKGGHCIDNPAIKSIFSKVYTESLIQDSVSDIAIDGLLLQAFAELLRTTAKSVSDKPLWVKRVVELLNDSNYNYFSLESLASELDLHPVYLSRTFPKYFNTTISDYIRSIKLEKASRLLIASSLSIAQIAYECKFSDESHFIKVFKKAYGMTPFQFRMHNI